jgi:hypothetical protein
MSSSEATKKLLRLTGSSVSSVLGETEAPAMTKTLCGALGVMLALTSVAAAQRPELPAGPNRELVSRECQACHDLGMVISATGLTREGWTNILAEMATYGMNVAPDDQAKIIEYLSTYLGPR